ncbi:MAG: hypothetical protein R2873_05120 [Caldilineaceae bacterium]
MPERRCGAAWSCFAEWNELSGTIISPNLDRIWWRSRPADVLPEICEQVDTYLADKGYPKQ